MCASRRKSTSPAVRTSLYRRRNRLVGWSVGHFVCCFTKFFWIVALICVFESDILFGNRHEIGVFLGFDSVVVDILDMDCFVDDDRARACLLIRWEYEWGFVECDVSWRGAQAVGMWKSWDSEFATKSEFHCARPLGILVFHNHL